MQRGNLNFGYPLVTSRSNQDFRVFGFNDCFHVSSRRKIHRI